MHWATVNPMRTGSVCQAPFRRRSCGLRSGLPRASCGLSPGFPRTPARRPPCGGAWRPARGCRRPRWSTSGGGAPGGVEIQPPAVVALALAQQRAGPGIGEQFDGVAGDDGEQGVALGGRGQLPDEAAALVAYRPQPRRRARRPDVDLGQRPFRPAARDFGSYQLGHVGPEFGEGPQPVGAGHRERGAGRDEPGTGQPGGQPPPAVELFNGIRPCRHQVQADAPGVEPQLVRVRTHTSYSARRGAVP